MELDQVITEAERVGPWVHVATVDQAGGPHVVPVHIAWHEGEVWAMTAPDSKKARNLASNPAVALHHQVAEATGWDSLIVWGTGRMHTDLETKQRLWEGVFDYDLNAFAPEGPSAESAAFMAVTPAKAVLLRNFGMGGREEWRAPATS